MAKRRILIVDDEPDLRAGIREILEWSGYEPAEASDGTQGLAQAARLRPDLILLDVTLPGLDGYEVCRRLKANPTTRQIPVMFLTGGEGAEVHRRATEAGAVACLTKPFRLAAIVAAVEGALTPGHPASPTPRTDGEGP